MPQHTQIVEYECIASQIIPYLFLEHRSMHKNNFKSRQITMWHENMIFCILLYICLLEHHPINKNIWRATIYKLASNMILSLVLYTFSLIFFLTCSELLSEYRALLMHGTCKCKIPFSESKWQKTVWRVQSILLNTCLKLCWYTHHGGMPKLTQHTWNCFYPGHLK